MNPETTLRYRRVLLALSVACMLFAVYQVAQSIIQRNNTGILNIITADSNTVISISQPDHGAKVLGFGSTRSRMRPGSYIVVAELSGNKTSSTVVVEAKKTISKNLNPVDASTLPSSEDPGFINFDALSNYGLSNDQMNYIEDMLNEFKPDAQNISLDPDMVRSIPHNPASNDPFGVTFPVTIDETPYSAQALYVADEDVQLVLTDSTGSQVYNGYRPTEAGGE